ncbi:hypothetical protein AJ78_07192 [Emergomyces pasteurianus Ep9510]|uniref:Uncharacterized protein n=1 Tax=Emergomyces pasteurianus Ep9510 TaxID=1447872 RepID=A0A1J9P652_9EURO|nr:hypothetical protein AJ78_07192 [Emergomyces pasteurianus Ep9510]
MTCAELRRRSVKRFLSELTGSTGSELKNLTVSETIVASAVQNTLRENLSIMLLHFLMHNTLVAEEIHKIIKNLVQIRIELS